MAKKRFGPLQAAIVALALATAVIHIVLGVPNNLPMFILNGLGYIVLAGALYLEPLQRYQTWLRLALMAFTLVTIVGWILVGERSMIAYVDKLIELALLALLIVDMRSRNDVQ